MKIGKIDKEKSLVDLQITFDEMEAFDEVLERFDADAYISETTEAEAENIDPSVYMEVVEQQKHMVKIIDRLSNQFVNLIGEVEELEGG